MPSSSFADPLATGSFPTRSSFSNKVESPIVDSSCWPISDPKSSSMGSSRNEQFSEGTTAMLETSEMVDMASIDDMSVLAEVGRSDNSPAEANVGLSLVSSVDERLSASS